MGPILFLHPIMQQKVSNLQIILNQLDKIVYKGGKGTKEVHSLIYTGRLFVNMEVT